MKKPNGKNRVIIDLSSLNNFVTKISFRMEGVEILKILIQPNNFMISIDLSDAFFSISLYPTYKRFVTFKLNSCRYAFNVLPFGISSSPRIFCKVLRPVIVYLRSQGIKISAYMDDLFLYSHSKILLMEHRTIALNLLQALGFIQILKNLIWSPLIICFIWTICGIQRR